MQNYGWLKTAWTGHFCSVSGWFGHACHKGKRMWSSPKHACYCNYTTWTPFMNKISVVEPKSTAQLSSSWHPGQTMSKVLDFIEKWLWKSRNDSWVLRKVQDTKQTLHLVNQIDSPYTIGTIVCVLLLFTHFCNMPRQGMVHEVNGTPGIWCNYSNYAGR